MKKPKGMTPEQESVWEFGTKALKKAEKHRREDAKAEANEKRDVALVREILLKVFGHNDFKLHIGGFDDVPILRIRKDKFRSSLIALFQDETNKVLLEELAFRYKIGKDVFDVDIDPDTFK